MPTHRNSLPTSGVNFVFSSRFFQVQLLACREDDDLSCIRAVRSFPFRRLAMLMPYDNRTLTQCQSSLSKDYLLISSVHAMLKQGYYHFSATSLRSWQTRSFRTSSLLISNNRCGAFVARCWTDLRETRRSPESSACSLVSHVQNFA